MATVADAGSAALGSPIKVSRLSSSNVATSARAFLRVSLSSFSLFFCSTRCARSYLPTSLRWVSWEPVREWPGLKGLEEEGREDRWVRVGLALGFWASASVVCEGDWRRSGELSR